MLGDPLEEDLLPSSTEDGEKLRKKIRRSEKQEQGMNKIFKKTWIITGTTRKLRKPVTKVKVLQKTKLCLACPGRSESNNVSYYETNKYKVENIIPCVYNQIILGAQWRQRIIDEGDHCASDTTRLLSHPDLTHLVISVNMPDLFSTTTQFCTRDISCPYPVTRLSLGGQCHSFTWVRNRLLRELSNSSVAQP